MSPMGQMNNNNQRTSTDSLHRFGEGKKPGAFGSTETWSRYKPMEFYVQCLYPNNRLSACFFGCHLFLMKLVGSTWFNFVSFTTSENITRDTNDFVSWSRSATNSLLHKVRKCVWNSNLKWISQTWEPRNQSKRQKFQLRPSLDDFGNLYIILGNGKKSRKQNMSTVLVGTLHKFHQVNRSSADMLQIALPRERMKRFQNSHRGDTYWMI